MARLLVVDDEPDLRDLLRVCLSMAGHQVEVVGDGQRGLARAQETKPDAVLLDVMMPGTDGWTVLAAIKSHPDPGVSAIPVIMLTARADDLDVVRGGIEGAVRYLTKPFGLEDLRQAVADAVNGTPEAEQRQAAQRAALTQFGRLERGLSAASETPAARPRFSRLEPVSGGQAPVVPPAAADWPQRFHSERLTGRDHEVLNVLATAANMSEARERLNVSRSYLYSRLRHLAAKLDFPTGPALVKALRTARAVRERESGRGSEAGRGL